MFDVRLFTSPQQGRNSASPLANSPGFAIALRRSLWLLLFGALLISTVPWHKSAAQKGDMPAQLNGFVQQANLIATDGEADDQLGKAVALSGDTVLVGAPADNVSNVNQGSAYVFRRNSGVWSQEAQLLAPDGQGGDAFGSAVALEGDVAVVGVPFADTNAGLNAGAVYVFRRTGNVWAFEQKLVPDDPLANDRFGNAVAISGDSILVGASMKDITPNADQGAAYVFKRTGATWAQQTRLTAPAGAANDNFGAAVTLVLDTAVVGAPGYDSSRGAAYVFTRSGSTWSFQQQLSNNLLDPNDLFGSALALNGETVVVGAPQGLVSDQGTAFVFTRSGVVWTEQAQLSANDGAGNDGFGTSVALIGDTALIGAPLDDLGFNDSNPDQGSAYVFIRTGTNWAQQEKLTINGGQAGDQAGIAVALSSQSAVLGIWLRDINQGTTSLDQGAAYVFDVTCPNLIISPSTLPAGAPNVAYNQTLTASGGLTPYTFMISSGALPSGLNLDSSGLLSGTTAETGNFSITVKATDRAGCFSTRPYSLVIGSCPTISLTPLIIAPAPINKPYIQNVVGTGGVAPYSHAKISGTLPPGISYSGGGVLNGTPTAFGSYTFTLRATDSNGCSGTRTYTLTITCQSITLNPETLPASAIGQSYSQTMTASGGTGPYSFVVSGGTLPTGLTLSADGLLSGTTTEAGTFNFGIKVTDAGGCTTTHAYSVPVCAAITVNPAFLPVGRPDKPYNPITFTATGSNGPYSFALNGTLPAGMSFNTDTLSGTPTQTGTFPLTLTVTGTEGCGTTRAYTLIISRRAAKADFDGDGKTDLSVWRGANGNWLVAKSGASPTSDTQWGIGTAPNNDISVPGDYDGDGNNDFAVFRRLDSTWRILQSSNGSVRTQQWGLSGDVPVPGDYDGDGKTDFAVWRPSSGEWYVIRSSNGTAVVQQWGFNGDVPVPGDYDSDGKTDIAVWRPSEGNWYVTRSTGGIVIQQLGVSSDIPVPSDYDGDGKTDFAVWRPSSGIWFVLRSGSGQVTPQQWGGTGDVPVPNDYDGDGRADFAVWRPSDGTWYIIRSATFSVLTQQWGVNGDALVPGDYNNDGKADLAVWHPSNGIWSVNFSGGIQVTTKQWGFPGDVIVPGDYDGDGKTDFAVWRPSEGIWYVTLSTGGVATQQWGVNGDVPVPGDYDGDGKTDFAIWKPSNGLWYVIRSSSFTVVVQSWGVNGDVPVPGDYDGDGKTDFAIWKPSNGLWYVIRSSTGTAVVQSWGVNGDVPVPGDYDGDGRIDFAIWKPSNGLWYVIRSSTGTAVVQQWGFNGDVPVPGDYDGDGRTDFAVWRPSEGNWYVIRSSGGPILIQQHGHNGDTPVPSKGENR